MGKGASPLRADRVLGPTAPEPATQSPPIRVTPDWRVETIGRATLYLGDCRDVLPALAGIDVTVTDPPYGVNLGARTGSSRYWNTPYASFEDTPENVRRVCVPAIESCLALAPRLAMTPGNKCMWMYPEPDDVGIWYNPASTNRGRWGFSFANAFIFYYGRDPHNIGQGMRPNSLSGNCDPVDGIDHPCPKPLLFTKWLVERASIAGETVLDPFMGSGTVGVACHALGRSFIGIEREERYFDAACERIEQAQRQTDLFLAQVDTHPKGGDALAAPFMGSAVPKGCAHD